MLGIQCFIPEIWQMGSPSTRVRIAWKRDFSRRWSSSGIPFLIDVSPGYDAQLVFPGSAYYGFTSEWLDALERMVEEFGSDGYVYNSWNGFTEGMAAMPLLPQDGGERYFSWLKRLGGRGFRRGDCNSDGTVDISDAVFSLGSLFLGDGDPHCDDACDSNDDGTVDISDAINTLGVLFLGNGAVLLPGVTECGVDPTDDEMGCEQYSHCP